MLHMSKQKIGIDLQCVYLTSTDSYAVSAVQSEAGLLQQARGTLLPKSEAPLMPQQLN